MNKPSNAMLAVFQAATQHMTSDYLLDLRNAFVAAGEHSGTVEAIDRELMQRQKNCSKSPTELPADGSNSAFK